MRQTATAPVMVALALFLLLPALYLGSYVALADTIAPLNDAGYRYVLRTYPNAWIAKCYIPLGQAEARLTGNDVRLLSKRGDRLIEHLGPYAGIEPEELEHLAEP